MRHVSRVLSVVAALGGFIVAPLTSGDTVILDPTEPVTGIVGLSGESFASGTVYSSAGAFSYSASVASSGEFSVPTATGTPFSLSIYLYQFQNTSGAQLYQYVYNQPALTSGESRQLDLRRPAGRVTGGVSLTGGVLESLYVYATSSDNRVPESFQGWVTTNAPPYLALVPMPVVPTSTTVRGTATVLTSNGCRVSKSLAARSVTVQQDATVAVGWTLDVSAETCNTGSLQGNLVVAGLAGQNSDVIESGRSVYVSGPDYRSSSLPANQEGYLFENLRQGTYSVGQSISFRQPYQSFSANAQSGVQIVAGQTTQYGRTLSLGTVHGTLAFRGPWGLSDLNYAQINVADGSGGGGVDTLDLGSGAFDLVLAAGTSSVVNWLYFNDSTYDPITGDTSSWYTYENPVGDTRAGITLATGDRVQLDELTVETSVASSLVFQVAQQDGQPLAQINRLDVNGNGYVRDPVTNATLSYRYLYQSDRRGATDVFPLALRGLPGTYQMQARGYGTDGRLYNAAFQVILGAPDGTPAGTNVENQITNDAGEVIGTLTFANVLQGGETTVSQASLGPNADPNFKIFKAGGQPQYFDITTTAIFDGGVEVCIHYDDANLSDPDNEAKLELGHYDEATGTWNPITNPDSPDIVNNIICGTTDSFSIFAILEVDIVDTDGDQFPDELDNCPVTANAGQQDFDVDGIGDACDTDSDGDDIPDATDLCPNYATTDNSDLDGDGLGDPCDSDVDGDGVLTASDNCPVVSNVDQTDFDVDGAGDQCDLDDDGDSTSDAADRCPGTALSVAIDSSGCSGAQRFEAACPIGGAYRNHGQYVSCVAKEAEAQVSLGIISEVEKGATVSAAAQSDIGNNK